jgi:hypothetical protein
MLPDRAGQPTQVQVHIGLGQLRDLPGASDAEAAWAAARAADGTARLTGAAADAAACDATIVPVVTGHVDWAALDRMADVFLDAHGLAPAAGAAQARIAGGPRAPLSPQARRRLNETLLHMAADVLSGPAGLAAYLRANLLDRPFTTISLPLDVGQAEQGIPAHLRRAVILRDKHCRYPGCCGPTALHHLGLVCRFHHLVVIHQWGWELTLHPDGTATATSPDGRVLHSHGPPPMAA